MPIFLYHGSASLKKRQFFFDFLKNNHFASDEQKPFLLLTSSHSQINRYKSEIVSFTNQKTLLGESLLSFDDFLLKLVKKNLHRAHLADENFSLYLIFLLLQTKFPELIKSNEPVFKLVAEFYQLFSQLKKLGISAEAASVLLKGSIGQSKIFDLFQEYQSQMRGLYHFDASDLFLATIEGLKKNRFSWFFDVSDIYLVDIYPLHAGHREILRQLKKTFPQKNFHIFYDEVYQRQEDLLYQAYLDLGDIADQTQYFDEEDNSEFHIQEYASPYEEIWQLAHQIEKDVQSGVAPHHITVACHHSYAGFLSSLLKKKNIPSYFDFAKSVKSFSQQSNPQPIPKKYQSELIQAFQENNSFAMQRIQAQNALERHLEKIHFAQSLLSYLRKEIPQDAEQNFLNHLANQLTYTSRTPQYEVILTDHTKALAYNNRVFYLAGFQVESLKAPQESSFFSSYLYKKRELAEILNFPHYQYKIFLEKLKQLLALTPHARIYRSSVDFSGRPTTPLFLEKFQFHHHKTFLPAQNTQISTPSEFLNVNKNSFSISELERYLQCPFQYYATYVLQLGQKDRKDLEPAKNETGSFVHAILQKFIENNQELYIAALSSTTAREELTQSLLHLIEEERKTSEIFQNDEIGYFEVFKKRLLSALSNLLQLEAQAHQEEKKKTLPRLVEWTISKDGQIGYPLCLGNETVFLKGRIDRIDVSETEQSFSVIDYKTGAAPTTASIKRGEALQIPLYLIAVQDLLFPHYQPSGGFYYRLGETKIEGMSLKKTCDENVFLHHSRKISLNDWEEIKDKTLSVTKEMILKIKNQEFAPNPKDPSHCQYCDFRRICGYNNNDTDT